MRSDLLLGTADIEERNAINKTQCVGGQYCCQQKEMGNVELTASSLQWAIRSERKEKRVARS